jgi:hypothetical protein
MGAPGSVDNPAHMARPWAVFQPPSGRLLQRTRR